MAVLNLRGMDDELVAQVKAASALAGVTIPAWVSDVLGKAVGHVGNVRSGKDEGSASGGRSGRDKNPKVEHHEPRADTVRNEVSVGVDAGSGESPAASQVVKTCPEDGDPMIWNEKMKRWDCVCGFQIRGKR
jgi:hypothetical protein